MNPLFDRFDMYDDDWPGSNQYLQPADSLSLKELFEQGAFGTLQYADTKHCTTIAYCDNSWIEYIIDVEPRPQSLDDL